MSAPERLAIIEARDDAIRWWAQACAERRWQLAEDWAHRAWRLDSMLRRAVGS